MHLHFKPGTQYRYSGEGINLVQFLIEQQNGRLLDQLMQEALFTPLDMTRTGIIYRMSDELPGPSIDARAPPRKVCTAKNLVGAVGVVYNPDNGTANSPAMGRHLTRPRKEGAMNLKSTRTIVAVGFVLLFAVVLMRAMSAQGSAPVDESVVKQGLAISPVPLNLHGKNRALVGLGSYLVNAVSECNDCHTRPYYQLGGNPFKGEPESINTLDYLTGGNQFGPFTSANLTPDASGLPAGLTLAEFVALMRTGLTDDHPQFGPVLQVMPWPTFRKMTDRDLSAMYEYLRAIPSRPDNPNPGPCCPADPSEF
jgi:Beta-lactamase